MFDLGTSLIASVARDPHAIAIIDAGVRLTYREWFGKISALVGAFDQLGLKPGDHILTALQNRWEAATLHWACQLAGLVITPINWRAKSDEIDFYLSDSQARVIVYQDVSADAVKQSTFAREVCRIAVGIADPAAAVSLADLLAASPQDVGSRVSADAWSIMLYTSGTTSKPKGVPRR
ncbi:MAG: 2-furoate---CoA ligase, partial [Bradyrhizobium sp.]|nr:2-furoate---CoA ligase [Bradyrhizobium sp.]